jgi:phytoene dehydrogenase-like protein
VDYDREGEDGDPLLEAGFDSLLSLLAQRLQRGQVAIHLNTRVTSIDWTSSGPVRIAVSPEGGYFEADHVIVTASLGVLKRDSACLFRPPLPEWKLNAMNSMGFGLMNKIFLR